MSAGDRERNRAYRAAHREEINARQRERYANDPEYRARRLESKKRYRDGMTEAQREHVREYHKEYYAAHRDEIYLNEKRRRLLKVRAERKNDGD